MDILIEYMYLNIQMRLHVNLVKQLRIRTFLANVI